MEFFFPPKPKRSVELRVLLRYGTDRQSPPYTAHRPDVVGRPAGRTDGDKGRRQRQETKAGDKGR